MVLKELEVQGFKSFPDKVKIQIRPGITAVVGPNGSGKSNISDAIRWVLGETSSRQLRGSGKMEDVIFGGTQKRGAMGFASVHLTLDNTERRLDVDSDDVILGRKLYRSGESEYSINGQNVRLKDIYELLLDTGLGRDGYSIIGQGRIAEIVAAKSGERREIFEEASGIARYRYRKNEAERSLNAAQDNLVRLNDILEELESRVGPLEKESEKAKKYLALAESRKGLEVTLWVEKIHKARENARVQERKLETAQADYDRITAEIEELERKGEELQREGERLIVENDRRTENISQIQEKISGLNQQKALLQNDIDHNGQRIAGYQAEIRLSEQSGEENARRVEEMQQGIEEKQKALDQIHGECSLLEQSLQELQQKNETAGEQKGALENRIAGLTNHQTEEKIAYAEAQSTVASLRDQLQETDAQLKANAEQLESDRSELQENAEYIKSLTAEQVRLQNIETALQMKLQKRRKQMDEADEAEQAAVRKLENARQRLNLLQDLEKNMDGYQNSVKSVMRAAAARRLNGVYGPVSKLIRVKPGYELAIETALGAAMQNIVVDSERSGKAVLRFLQAENAGRATCIPLDTVQGFKMNEDSLNLGTIAADVVQCDSRYEKALNYLLGRVVLVETLDDATAEAKHLHYKNRVVTLDGQVINAGGTMTGGSNSRSAGIFSRGAEIEKLRGGMAAMEAEVDKAQELTDRWKAEVDELEAQLTATTGEKITGNSDKIRAEAEDKRLQANVSQLEAAALLLEGKKQQQKETILRQQEIMDKAGEELEKLEKQLNILTDELTALEGSDGSFAARSQELGDKITAYKLQELDVQKDVEHLRQGIESLQQQTGQKDEQINRLQQSIQALEQDCDNLRLQIEQAEQQAENCRGDIAALEAEKEQNTLKRLQLRQQQTEQGQAERQASEQREQISSEIGRLKERQLSSENEYNQTVTRLWEEYELSLSDAEPLTIPFENVTELTRQVNEVRGKIRALGNVNVNAIEEYQIVSKRYNEQKAQVEDIEKSRAELLRMINQLSGEMETLFKASFEQINGHFGRIFRELFGGGSASLLLTDADNVLESGIEIRVQPPGKVIKNLSALSGGEQSLVAICIYFAILAVNPAPFCILDEIEAALDDVNVVRYAQYLKRINDKTQFIVITHRRGTMEAADVLYGVTMQEDGVSKLLKLDVENADAILVN